MLLTTHVSRDAEGQYVAIVRQVPHARAADASATKAIAVAQSLALRLLAEQVERGDRLLDITAINFQATIYETPPLISRTQAAWSGAVGLGAVGALALGASQWWMASQLARETGRPFAAQFRERPVAFLTTWISVLTMFVVVGALAGFGVAQLRDWLRRPSANDDPGAKAV